jgi:hypothetical protein
VRTRAAVVVLLVAAAAAAAIVANILLLGGATATSGPVGQLSPRTHLPAPPHWTVRPTTGHPADEGADD